MATRLAAPYLQPATVILLPNPQDEDNEGLEASLHTHVSISGVRRVYRRTNGGTSRLVGTFVMSLDVGDRLRQFIEVYAGSWWRYDDYRGRIWRVMLTTNPVVFNEHKRTRISTTLEFLGAMV